MKPIRALSLLLVGSTLGTIMTAAACSSSSSDAASAVDDAGSDATSDAGVRQCTDVALGADRTAGGACTTAERGASCSAYFDFGDCPNSPRPLYFDCTCDGSKWTCSSIDAGIGSAGGGSCDAGSPPVDAAVEDAGLADAGDDASDGG